jgi:hypothetical protein
MNVNRKNGLILLMTLTSICSCDMRDEYVIDGSKKLYSFGYNLESFLSSHGYSNYSIKSSHDLARNLKGDELWVFNWKEETKALTITCGGEIFEWRLPSRIWRKSVWLDQKNQVVAWIKKGVLHYSTSSIDQKPELMLSVKNKDGGYFVRSLPSRKVAIFSLESPDSPLAVADVPGTGLLRIFSKGKKLYLFDYKKEDVPLMGYVFLKKGSALLKIEEIEIPRPHPSPVPFYVEDLSPWSDEILLIDGHDWPIMSKWYIFNLATREMKKLGNADGYGFFLSCDILKKQ